jgi:excinuclease ABC subunit C
MVVATPQGFSKKEYRTFTMHSQDDYDMMRTVMKRRFSGALPLPDLMIIDGGKGQLSVVCQILKELGVQGPRVISIAKAQPHDLIYVADFCESNQTQQSIQSHQQRSSKETLCVGPSVDKSVIPSHPSQWELLDTMSKSVEIRSLPLPEHHTVLHLVQRLRDEAHRFAVTTHRKAKRRRMTTSLLRQLPGIGPKRHKLLMGHFGSLQGVLKASEQDLLALFPQSIAAKIKKSLQDFQQ